MQHLARIPLAARNKANNAAALCLAGTKIRYSAGLPSVARENASAKRAPPARIGSFWAVVGDKECFFRSTWEANVARYFEWLRQHGNIADWFYEPETFWFSGIKRGVVSYKPDFRVHELDGRTPRYEVKGYMDPRSATKIRRMAKYYPDVELRVIDAKAYRQFAKQVGPFIRDWQ